MDHETDLVSGNTRILIAVGVRLYREVLTKLLMAQPGFTVVGTAEQESNALSRAQILQPDVTLLDAGFTDGPATVRALLHVAPGTRVIALDVVETESQILSYAETGVSGYFARDGSFEDLVAAIRSVVRGELLCSPRVAAALLRRVAQVGENHGPDIERLTPRELQIAGLINQGLANKEIASRLGIEVSTVKNHVHNLLEKLGATGRGQAAARLRHSFFGDRALEARD